jgi:hypothetical protein
MYYPDVPRVYRRRWYPLLISLMFTSVFMIPSIEGISIVVMVPVFIVGFYFFQKRHITST